MAGSTNFLRWNPDGNNQQTSAEYEADSTRNNGAQSGIYPSALHNKFAYQQAMMTAALGQMLANKGYTVTDEDFNNLVAALTNIMTVADMAPYAPPIGSVIWTAGSLAPAGYLKANGAAVSRSTYAALFAAIGTTYGGGNGTTTFNLPDLRGEFVRGFDDGRGVDAGRAMGSNQGDALGTHSHGITDSGHYHGHGTVGGAGWQADNESAGDKWYAANNPSQTDAATTGISVNNAGSAETRPRNVALLACIKY